ncbi:MAG: hypothetical protein QXU18_00345 [Thermoplasmatales archaeon]
MKREEFLKTCIANGEWFGQNAEDVRANNVKGIGLIRESGLFRSRTGNRSLQPFLDLPTAICRSLLSIFQDFNFVPMFEIISNEPGEPQDESLDSYDGIIMNGENIYDWKPAVNFTNREEPEYADMNMSTEQLAYDLRDVGTLVRVKNGRYEVMDELYRGW